MIVTRVHPVSAPRVRAVRSQLESQSPESAVCTMQPQLMHPLQPENLETPVLELMWPELQPTEETVSTAEQP